MSATAQARRPPVRILAKLKALAVKVLLSLIVFTLCIVLSEIVVRLIGYEPIYGVYSKPSIFWKHDPLLGWSHEPNARGTYIGPKPWPVEFSTSVEINSAGLRGPEVAPLLPDGVRILFLGDSRLAAFEVEYEQTFAARIEEELARSLAAPVQVLNAGVRGYGTDQSYLYFRERGSKWEPDAVVLAYSANDPRNNITLHRMRRPFGKAAFVLAPDGSLKLVGHPIPKYPLCCQLLVTPQFEIARTDTWRQRFFCRLQMNLLDHSALFTVVTFALTRHPALVRTLHSSASPTEAFGVAEVSQDWSIQLTEAILRELGSEVQRVTGAPLLIIGDDHELSGFARERIAEVCEVFSYEAVHDGNPEDVYFKNDRHFTAPAHERIAQLVAPVLAARLRPLVEERRQLSGE
jgi:lysophospholipase L1-like esterase